MAAEFQAPHFRDQLLFPLRLEVLFAQGIMFVVALPLFLTRDYWIGGDDGGTTVWTVLHWTGVTLFLAMLVEYGFAVIDNTVRGSRRIPVFSFAFLSREIGAELADAIGNLGNIAGLKLLKQQLMVMAFLGLAWFLHNLELALPAGLVTLFFIVVLPASMAINAVSGAFLALLNPVRLTQFAWEQGAAYPVCVMALLAAWFFFTSALQGTLIVFLLCLPPGLYFSVLTFRVLGDCLHAKRDRYFPRVDFSADRAALARLSQSREFLDRRLQAILHLIRNREVDRACRELVQFLDSNDWRHFDPVFTAVSGWPDPRPALAITAVYLPRAIAGKKYMQALRYCEWCLRQASGFTLQDDEHLLALADQAATPTQYRVMLRLLLNYADREPDRSRSVLEKAVYLATVKLNDDKRLEEIMARMDKS